MSGLTKKNTLIKKLTFIFIMTFLIVSMPPFLTSVSAAVLDDTAILNKINQTEINTTFNGLGQCYGFAKETFANIFDLNNDDVFWDYEQGSTASNYIYLIKKTEAESDLASLLSLAKAGDILCWGGGYGNPHSMIFISNDNEKQEITVLDNNWGDYNIIKIHAITYPQLSELINGGNSMSLFGYTPEKISLSADSATLYLGAQTELQSAQLTCAVTSDTYPAPVWSSSDNSVAAVDQNGMITAIGAGEAVVTCRIGNKNAQCAVTVEASISDINFKYKHLSLTDLKFLQFHIKINGMPPLPTDITLNPAIENLRQ